MACSELKAELLKCRSELDATRQQLENERASRASYLAGDIRRYESQFKEFQDLIESERVHYRHLISNNKTYLTQAKKLGTEREKMLEEIATLRSDLLLAKREIRNLRKDAADHARSQRELRRELRRENLDLEAYAKKAEAVGESFFNEAALQVEEARLHSKYADRQLKKAESLVAAAERRASMKEHKLLTKEACAEDRAARVERRMQRTIEVCDQAVVAAEAELRAAEDDAHAARREAMEEAAHAQEAQASKSMSEYQNLLLQRQVDRAKEKADRLQKCFKDLVPISCERTAEEWTTLCDDARRKAAQRERIALRNFFSSHGWRAQDLATVLEELGMLRELFNTKEGQHIFFERVKELHNKLESSNYGLRFGLFLHFEMRLTMAKIQQIVEAACKEFHPALDRYKKTSWHSNPYIKKEVLHTPRIVPSRSKLEVVIKQLQEELGVQANEDGLLAFISFDTVIQEILMRDAGKLKMPPLREFVENGRRLPIVISRDATGKGSLQFTTVAARSPWATKSAQLLHIFGFGCCSDGREGTMRLLGQNLDRINSIIDSSARGECISCDVTGEQLDIHVDLYFTDDVAALRHGEHLANSGWCGCSREEALRVLPKKPETIAEMKALVSGQGVCRELSCLEREILSHNPPKGETVPRPCIARNCKFAHDPAHAANEYAALLATEAELAKDTSKAGKRKFTEWRMQHAYKGDIPHLNVQPGAYGKPLLRHHFSKQILDSLHLGVLGLPKIPWKHGVKNNASDDALERISEQLKLWKHPLDMRRKDDGRVREQKWFTGEKWLSFCAGNEGSPGGPIAIATVVLIIAEDLQLRGVDSGTGLRSQDDSKRANRSASPVAGGASSEDDGATRPSQHAPNARSTAKVGKHTRGHGRAAFASRVVQRAAESRSGARSAQPEQQEEEQPAHQLQYQPSATELASNQDSLQVIRKVYGSRAQTLINALLAFDAYFKWFYPFRRSVPYLCEMELRESRALANCRSAIDMHEMFERVSIHNHSSFLPHGAVFKVTRDILAIGDVHAHDLSALELQNAESKRVFEAGGSRRMQFSAQGTTHKRDGQGGHKLVMTKGYGATAATTTLFKLLATKKLRQGDGSFSTPASRRGERLFGENAVGRSKLVKFEFDERDAGKYDPEQDTCLDAFVRLLEARIRDQMSK